MPLLIAADTTSIGLAADGLSGAFSSLPPGSALPSLGDPDADAALGGAATAFSRHAQALSEASTRGARSLSGFSTGFVKAGT